MAPGDAPIRYDNDLVSAYDGMIADACGQLGGDTFTLNLSTLRQHYPRAGGNEPTADDRLEESHTDQDSYARIYQDIVAHHPDFLNKTYGHAVRDAGGQLWLQYWFFETAGLDGFLGEQDSPHGPEQHDQWDDPGTFAATKAEPNGCDNNRTGDASASAFASSSLAHTARTGHAHAVRLTTARIRHGHASIGYRLARLRQGGKHRIVLLVSLHPAGRPRARAWRRVIVRHRHGTLQLSGFRLTGRRWIANVTAIAPDGELSAPATRRIRR